MKNKCKEDTVGCSSWIRKVGLFTKVAKISLGLRKFRNHIENFAILANLENFARLAKFRYLAKFTCLAKLTNFAISHIFL